MDFRSRLDKWNAADLSPEQRADFEIVSDQIALGLLELDTIQSYRHNPTLYVELIGNALFNPLVLEYADKPQRIRHIIARLGKVPGLLEQARQNLSSAPGIWTTVAMEENQGNIDLIDKTLRVEVPAAQKPAYDQAAAAA